MTTIVALRGKTKIALVADTRITWSGDKAPGVVGQKLVELKTCGGGWVGYSGNAVIQTMFEAWLGTPTVPLEPAGNDPTLSLFRTFQAFWKYARAEYTLVRDQPDDASTTNAEIRGSFLVAIPAGIFSIGCDFSVTEHEIFYGMGSGGDYAMGALAAMLTHEGERPPDVRVVPFACRAVEVACQFDTATGRPLNVQEVELA